MNKSRIHLLKVRSLDNQWHDKDELFLHAAFQILVDFVEKERPFKYIDWSYDKLHRQTRREIKSLYAWWKNQRFRRRDPLDDKRLKAPPFKFEKIKDSSYSRMVQPDKKKHSAYYRALKRSVRLEEKWRKEDQRNLHRLVEIRHFLWT